MDQAVFGPIDKPTILRKREGERLKKALEAITD